MFQIAPDAQDPPLKHRCDPCGWYLFLASRSSSRTQLKCRAVTERTSYTACFFFSLLTCIPLRNIPSALVSHTLYKHTRLYSGATSPVISIPGLDLGSLKLTAPCELNHRLWRLQFASLPTRTSPWRRMCESYFWILAFAMTDADYRASGSSLMRPSWPRASTRLSHPAVSQATVSSSALDTPTRGR